MQVLEYTLLNGDFFFGMITTEAKQDLEKHVLTNTDKPPIQSWAPTWKMPAFLSSLPPSNVQKEICDLPQQTMLGMSLGWNSHWVTGSPDDWGQTDKGWMVGLMPFNNSD